MHRCLGLVAVLAACSSATPSGRELDASGTPAGDARFAAPCDPVEPMVPRAALAATPRPDARAELLAIETSGALVAPDPLYERVTRELAAIARLDPRTADIEPFVEFAAELIVIFEEDAWRGFEKEQYLAWNCLNEAYGVTQIDGDFLPRMRAAKLSFGDRRLNSTRLVEPYAALPGVKAASTNGSFGDGPDVCLEIQGDTHYYVFDKAGGDCPAGCTEHLFLGFEVEANGAVKQLGSHAGFDPPAWLAKHQDCLARL